MGEAPKPSVLTWAAEVLALDSEQMQREGLTREYRDQTAPATLVLTPKGWRRVAAKQRDETDTDPCMALGAAIRQRRQALGDPQDAAAWRAGLDRSYYGAIERGERNPTYRMLIRIATGLATPLSTLIADAEQLSKSEGAS